MTENGLFLDEIGAKQRLLTHFLLGAYADGEPFCQKRNALVSKMGRVYGLLDGLR
jgi:hypothetical protein